MHQFYTSDQRKVSVYISHITGTLPERDIHNGTGAHIS